MSDKEIFNKSGIALLLEPGDAVMADRGFDCAGELALIDVDLHMPPFLHSSQVSPSQVQETRDIANLRIHNERMIGSIKNYRILKPGIPNKMAKNPHKIWLVWSMLPNFNNYSLLNRITNKKLNKYIIVFI